MRQIITENDVDDALHVLRERAKIAAEVKAQRVYIEETLKTVKARLMKGYQLSGIQSVSAQEREALADPEYLAHLERVKEAVEADELERIYRVNATMTIEAWRTEQANFRAMEKL